MPKSSTNWPTVDIEEIISIHTGLINQAGTIASIRDFALLHSAVERPNATFSGQDLYPSPFLKAAALLQSLCLNHPFTDGNKRTAWLSTKLLLFKNGYHLKSTRTEAAGFMVFVGKSEPDIKFITAWLKSHSPRI
jgi:death-on-curing protein